jgi:hypothetical protein
MKKKRAKKSNRGRKPNRAVLSGIKPDQETWDEIRCRLFWGSNEWPMVALQNLIKNGSQLPSNYLSAPSDVRCSPYTQRSAGIYPLWSKLRYEFERALLNGDFDWFRQQANAIEKGGSKQRAQFNAKVVLLLEQAWSETLGRPENWRPLSDAEREAFPNLTRVPEVVTLTPAGKFTDSTASNIFNALDVREVEARDLSQLVPGYKDSGKKKASEHEPSLVVEGCPFEKKERVMDAIHDLATSLQFELKKQARKH